MPYWIELTHWGSRLILFILGSLSVWSVKIMLDCVANLKDAKLVSEIQAAETLIREKKWDALQQWAKTHTHIYSGTLLAALQVPSKDPSQVDRAVRSFLAVRKTRLERGLTPLATLGSNAPFIGLFGTVLGIIQAFGVLGTSQSASSSVMTGVSESLVATAIGLLVAIPAVVAYNFFSRQLKVILVQCEALRDLYLSQVD